MRGSGWLPVFCTLVLFMATVALPLTSQLIWNIIPSVPPPSASMQLLPTPAGPSMTSTAGDAPVHARLLLTTVSWACAASLAAIAIGWLPGRVLGSVLESRRFVPFAAACIIPLSIPPYILFYSWWQAWPPNSWLFRWAAGVESFNAFQFIRNAVLFMSIVGWSWPMVALCVAGCTASTPIERQELFTLDGAPAWVRLLDAIRCDARGLLVGGLIVLLLAFNETTCFDLALVTTIGNELRALREMGATTSDLLRIAAPSMAVTLVAAAALWLLLARPVQPLAARCVRTGPRSAAFSLIIWSISFALPVMLLLVGLRAAMSKLDEFIRFYTLSLGHSAIIAAIVATCCAVMCIGFIIMWQDHRVVVRTTAHIMAACWLIMAVLPGALLGALLESAYNHSVFHSVIYASPAILVLAMTARFGVLAALLARWLAGSEPQELRELRSIDGAQTLVGVWLSLRPRLLSAVAAVGCLSFLLSLCEIPVTAAIRPVAFDVITPTILNDMHYQRPETVILSMLIFLSIAFAVAIVLALIWRQWRRKQSTLRTALGVVVTAVMVGFCFGCKPTNVDTTNIPPLNSTRIFGFVGTSLGQFNYPRGLVIDDHNSYIYVVDKSARIQRFGKDGKPHLAWLMPESDNGKPTGLSISPEGHVFVADTHYWRILVFDSLGNELMRFGSYGTEPGQFIYPTDIAFGPNGTIYVAEYGGNDRIQVFSSRGEFLDQFGQPGDQPGQFSRPQAIAFNSDRTELFIADSCNHRIVVTDPKGNLLRMFGTPGLGPGQLSYPYGLTILADGTLLVVEFGSSRIQHLDPRGQCLGLYGSVGRAPGELWHPWAVDSLGDDLFVLDSGNNRVQVFTIP